jgi:hypothetical protein
MTEKSHDKNWKLKLKYGKLVTPYKHFSVIAEGIVISELKDGYSCRPGSAFMAIKAWATSNNEAYDMISWIAEQLGFKITGRIQIFTTEADKPPEDQPFIYDIDFRPFEMNSTF